MSELYVWPRSAVSCGDTDGRTNPSDSRVRGCVTCTSKNSMVWVTSFLSVATICGVSRMMLGSCVVQKKLYDSIWLRTRPYCVM